MNNFDNFGQYYWNPARFFSRVGDFFYLLYVCRRLELVRIYPFEQ